MTFDPATGGVPLPIACLLPRDTQQARSDELQTLFAEVTAIDELPEGYTFFFPTNPQLGERLLTFVMTERVCCPFLHFALRSIAPHDGLWLDLSGAEGSKEVIAQSFVVDTMKR